MLHSQHWVLCSNNATMDTVDACFDSHRLVLNYLRNIVCFGQRHGSSRLPSKVHEKQQSFMVRTNFRTTAKIYRVVQKCKPLPNSLTSLAGFITICWQFDVGLLLGHYVVCGLDVTALGPYTCDKQVAGSTLAHCSAGYASVHASHAHLSLSACTIHLVAAVAPTPWGTCPQLLQMAGYGGTVSRRTATKNWPNCTGQRSTKRLIVLLDRLARDCAQLSTGRSFISMHLSLSHWFPTWG